VTALSFPNSDTLCEDCGYALKGLQPQGDCPECGLAIEASSPVIRTGPGWQDKPGPQPGLNILMALIRDPKHFFRTMRVDGSNSYPRLFLILTAAGIGLGWFVGARWGYGADAESAMIQTGIVALSVMVLSYIEALGVVFFSRRRGWRVRMRLAERIVCYCSIAWVPAALVVGLALILNAQGMIDRAMRGLLGVWGTWQSVELMVLIGAIAMLWFEILVWIGVRQTRHANAHPPDDPGEPKVDNNTPLVET